MSKHDHIVAQLNSWETGYISPSAQMAVKDARIYIEELFEINEYLKNEIDKLKTQAGKHREVEF